ncbi:hypothetical protein BKA62DRAFT_775493 [Auriculariales sp. MPI-PUGE-AT-0066]|nr:hypothetical protein BKA62DRAFT_775493 [Auriculariales sp. MPI-PUGE-AT-0066]
MHRLLLMTLGSHEQWPHCPGVLCAQINAYEAFAEGNLAVLAQMAQERVWLAHGTRYRQWLDSAEEQQKRERQERECEQAHAHEDDEADMGDVQPRAADDDDELKFDGDALLDQLQRANTDDGGMVLLPVPVPVPVPVPTEPEPEPYGALFTTLLSNDKNPSTSWASTTYRPAAAPLSKRRCGTISRNVGIYAEEQHARELALGEWAWHSVLDGIWTAPHDDERLFHCGAASSLDILLHQQASVMHPCPSASPTPRPNAMHAHDRVLTLALAHVLNRAYTSSLRGVVLPALQNLVRRLV